MNLESLPAISGDWYTVTFHAPLRLMKLACRKGRFYTYLPLVSACDGPDARDVHRDLEAIRLRRRGRVTVLTFTERSALWERKEYTVEFHRDRIVYGYTVHGRGAVGRAYFFRSWFHNPRTVEGEMGVAPGFDTVFSPQVNFQGKVYHFAGDTAGIVAGDETRYWGNGLVAAPLCFALNARGDRTWVWAGLGLRAGEYTFEEFNYNSNVTQRIFGAGGFDCNYNGKLTVSEQWSSPRLVIGAAGDPYAATADYVSALGRHYGLPRRRSPRAAWWRTPIFCGWGEQMSLGFVNEGNLEGVTVGQYCTQAYHDEWLERLRRHRVRPGQIIIDAGWQAGGTTGDMVVHPDRWPNLRGWIEDRRREGIRVLLWIMAWSREGVPDAECITRDGTPVNVDPTNPDYERRLRAMVRRLLSADEGCYNADGLKIDGELCCPMGPGLVNRENLWGLELQRRWMSIVHDEAKKHKRDALIGTYMANPYLADLTDVSRTADLFSIHPTPEETMVHRAKILSIGQPGCPIDTDHTFWYDIRENWIDIMPAQLRVGVPCLYHARYVWHKRPFTMPWLEEMTDAHYNVVRKTFQRHWRRLERAGAGRGAEAAARRRRGRR